MSILIFLTPLFLLLLDVYRPTLDPEIDHQQFVIKLVITRQTRYIAPMLVQCRTTVYDAGPTLNQNWVNVLCLLGTHLPE